MATVYLIFALVIAAVAIVFALQNTMTVTISFLAWKVTGSLSLVLLATLAIGALIGLLVLAPSAIKKTLTASSHRKRIGILEKELDEHRLKVAELQKPKPVAPIAEQSQSSSGPNPPEESPQTKP